MRKGGSKGESTGPCDRILLKEIYQLILFHGDLRVSGLQSAQSTPNPCLIGELQRESNSTLEKAARKGTS